MKNLVCTLLIALSLAGCATQKLSVANYEGTSRFDYTFPADNVKHSAVSQIEASNAVRQALITRTHYHFAQNWVGSLYKFSGLYMTGNSPSSVTAVFSNGENYTHRENGFSQSPHQTSIQYDLDVDTKDMGTGITKTTVQVSPTVRISQGRDPLGVMPYSQLLTPAHASAEVDRILSHKDWIVVQRTVTLNGEVDAKYDPASVLGNFTRALQPYGNPRMDHDRLEDNHAFSYTFQGKSLTLNVSTMPFHGGTKVRYQLSIPYILSGDGLISVTPEDVARAQHDIEAIALR